MTELPSFIRKQNKGMGKLQRSAGDGAGRFGAEHHAYSLNQVSRKCFPSPGENPIDEDLTEIMTIIEEKADFLVGRSPADGYVGALSAIRRFVHTQQNQIGRSSG